MGPLTPSAKMPSKTQAHGSTTPRTSQALRKKTARCRTRFRWAPTIISKEKYGVPTNGRKSMDNWGYNTYMWSYWIVITGFLGPLIVFSHVFTKVWRKKVMMGSKNWAIFKQNLWALCWLILFLLFSWQATKGGARGGCQKTEIYRYSLVKTCCGSYLMVNFPRKSPQYLWANWQTSIDHNPLVRTNSIYNTSNIFHNAT